MIKKKILTLFMSVMIALTGIVPTVTTVAPVTTMAATTYKDGLNKVNGTWKYYKDGKFTKSTGVVKKASDDGHFYYIKNGVLQTPSKATWILSGSKSYQYKINTSGKVVAVRPCGKQVTWIGDSLTVLGKPYSDLYGTPDVTAQIGKGWNYTRVGTSGGTSGEDIFNSLYKKNKLRKYIVIALGSNRNYYGSSDSTSAANVKKEKTAYENVIRGILKKAGSDKKVIIMTSYCVGDNGTLRKAYNEVARNMAKKYNNLYVVDWANNVKTSWLSDAVHCNSTGYAKYKQYFNSALEDAAMDHIKSIGKKAFVW